jgi:hypothetical protein
MFIDQSKIYPFPKVTPIRIPAVIKKIRENYSKIEYFKNSISKEYLEDLGGFFKEWYNPLINLESYPYVYFMNNGITQGLESVGLMYKNINLFQGDYSWLKTIKAGIEVTEKTDCDYSYASCPSAINGNIDNTAWPSEFHILDGAYVGTSTLKTIVPPNTEIVLLGFSKNLGVPELRAGLIFSKTPIQHLEVLQKVFGYIGSHPFESIKAVCENLTITDLADRLKKYQEKYCSKYPDFLPSDSALLATTNNQEYKFYRRPNSLIRIPLGESITYCIENNLI